MKSRLWLNVFLLLLVASLAFGVFLKRQTPTITEHRISGLNAADATDILLERLDGTAIRLKKRDGAWRLASPFAARADSYHLNRMLGILAARSQEKLPAKELARFDLDKPRLNLTINRQRFSFGGLNHLTQQQYVFTENAVYLISARHFADAAVQPADFVAKQLFAENETPQRFSLTGQDLALVDGKWVATPPRSGMSQDPLNAWRDEWRNASALLAQPYIEGQQRQGEIQITLQDGKQLTLAILQQTPELVLLREDEHLQYHFPQDLGKRLLLPLLKPDHARATGS